MDFHAFWNQDVFHKILISIQILDITDITVSVNVQIGLITLL